MNLLEDKDGDWFKPAVELVWYKFQLNPCLRSTTAGFAQHPVVVL
jgi:hypothetical protein